MEIRNNKGPSTDPWETPIIYSAKTRYVTIYIHMKFLVMQVRF